MGTIVKIFTTVLAFGTAITGTTMNSLLLMILHRIKTSRKSYFALIKSLIIADLLLPSSIIVSFVTDLLYLYEYLLFVILLHLILLVMEHYVAIIRPLHYSTWIRGRYIVCRLATVWIIPVILVVISTYLPEKQLVLKISDWTIYTRMETKDIFRLPFILGCFIGIVVVNIYMYKAVRRQQRLHDFQNHQATHNNKVLVITILNVGSFFVCWFPVVIAEIIFQIKGPTGYDTYYNNKDIKHLAECVVLLNSVCDPLIYAIRLAEVRKMWQKLFCCLCKKSLFQRVKARQIMIHYSVSKSETYMVQ